eukprot:CAMPEP_0115857204 /NCGR_PEP_ID=MMETSP0287-20121206/15454_1 /TAXON_ID=412157 /ORGANISM="Chrysochromulina rotalis, Strain UIO044" /LENGTH=72 /DNA_ID=CAMNT_0003311415 /DNA_START=555 /DNA_END=773 /DNA_ORIENTATION=+
MQIFGHMTSGVGLVVWNSSKGLAQRWIFVAITLLCDYSSKMRSVQDDVHLNAGECIGNEQCLSLRGRVEVIV